MSNNLTFDYMLKQPDMALTVEKFVELNWWGEKTLSDLEGEDWCEIQDFEEKLRALSGEEEED
jgi:hypothetical protein